MPVMCCFAFEELRKLSTRHQKHPSAMTTTRHHPLHPRAKSFMRSLWLMTPFQATLKPSHLNGTLTWWTLDMPGHPGSLHSTMSLCQYLFYLVWFLSCWCGDGYNWQGFWRLVSEVNALRTELLLPRDSANFVLLREPKSRFTYAKVDSQDLVAIVDLTFRELKPHNRLWPCSSQTLRSRFKSVLSALGLPTMSTLGNKCLDMGSLRSGCATFIILTTENGELCRRRGRWANFKMMEVYVQECMALQYTTKIPNDTREHVVYLAGAFQMTLEKVSNFSTCKNPWEFMVLFVFPVKDDFE